MVGERGLIILYPAESGSGARPCTARPGFARLHLLAKPVFRDELVRRMSTLPRPERG